MALGTSADVRKRPCFTVGKSVPTVMLREHRGHATLFWHFATDGTNVRWTSHLPGKANKESLALS